MIAAKTLMFLVRATIALGAVTLLRAAPFDDAVAAYKGGNYKAALEILRPLAEQGDAKAQDKLGLMYALGQGVKQDFAEAMTWYRKAADQGDAEAQNALGDMYSFGHGVAEDEPEAMRWYRKAADQGFSDAQFSVGYLYEHSESITRDLKEAARWYQLAAEQNDADAEFALGELYRDGRGVPQSNEVAYKWFRRAAESSDRSYRDHAIGELHLLAGKSPAEFDAPVTPDPFGRRFEMIWPSGGVRAIITWVTVVLVCGVILWLFEIIRTRKYSATLRLDEFRVSSPSTLARKAEIFFWLAYILLPFLTGGWQAYHWLPKESYEFGNFELLGSHQVCDSDGRCGDMADSWKDKETGEVYRREDFSYHRHSEAFRIALTWFVYGAIGCFAFAYFRNLRNSGTFWKYLRWAFCANAALATFAFIGAWR